LTEYAFHVGLSGGNVFINFVARIIMEKEVNIANIAGLRGLQI